MNGCITMTFAEQLIIAVILALTIPAVVLAIRDERKRR